MLLVMFDIRTYLTLSPPLGNDQRDDKPVAVLESRGSKGCVLVNGKTIKKNTSCDLNSGDEVVFGFLGSHAYVSFYLFSDAMILVPHVLSSLWHILNPIHVDFPAATL